MLADPFQWAHYHGMMVNDGVRFTLEDTPYLVDLVNCDRRETCVIKGSQVRVTTSKMTKAFHRCWYRTYEKNVLYMMPKIKDVERLCSVSFLPMIDCNPWLKKQVGVANSSQIQINGRSIVFTGAQAQRVAGSGKDSSNLRSVPCDSVMRDEIDLMDEDMVEQSKERLNDSLFKHEDNFGSPTFPDYGIDRLYKKSDMRKWKILCSCGKYTDLAEDFPRSVQKFSGDWRRACVHCGKEIFVRDGLWIPDYPNRDVAGFWVSGLLSPRADLNLLMARYSEVDGQDMCKFMQSILGIASAAADCQLEKHQVLGLLDKNTQNSSSSTKETVMGVDVGNVLHAVVGYRTGEESYKIIGVRRCKDFNELIDYATKMNVRYCVIDAQPDIHASRDFAKVTKFQVFRCYYSEQMPGIPKFDYTANSVKCNRNEWCDTVYDVVTAGRISLPRDCDEIREYADELTRTAKTIQEHPETGVPRPKWIKLGADHYYHATLYFLLGCKCSRPVTVTASQVVSNKKEYDPLTYGLN